MSDGAVTPSATTARSSRVTRAISTVDELGVVLVQRSTKRGDAGVPTLGRRATRIARTPHASCTSMTGATSAQVGAGTPLEVGGRTIAVAGLAGGRPLAATLAEGSATATRGGWR